MNSKFGMPLFWLAVVVVLILIVPKPITRGQPTAPSTDLVGQPLYDGSNTPVAEVASVVVDVTSGDVAYVLVRLTAIHPSRSPESGNSDYVAIPWQNVTRHRDANGLTMTVDSEKLHAAPRWGALPDTTQAGWDVDVLEAWR